MADWVCTAKANQQAVIQLLDTKMGILLREKKLNAGPYLVQW